MGCGSSSFFPETSDIFAHYLFVHKRTNKNKHDLCCHFWSSQLPPTSFAHWTIRTGGTDGRKQPKCCVTHVKAGGEFRCSFASGKTHLHCVNYSQRIPASLVFTGPLMKLFFFNLEQSRLGWNGLCWGFWIVHNAACGRIGDCKQLLFISQRPLLNSITATLTTETNFTLTRRHF